MSRLDSVFQKLPVMLQQAACHLEGWRIARHRYGGDFGELLRTVEARAFWSREQIDEYQGWRLGTFLEHARQNTRFYAGQRMDAPWPVIEKRVVQERTAEFIASGYEKGAHWAHTSGTTGAGLRFPVTRRAHQEQWAVWWRYRHWHGISAETWCGYFGGRMVVPFKTAEAPYWRDNAPGRQILFSGQHLRDETLPHYVAELRRRKPRWLHGYPSLLALVADYLVTRGEDLGYLVRWVTTGAENLLPHQARLIERAFGVRPRQHYGMAEGAANISECERGHLHVDEDFSVVEFLPAEEGAYRVVGTNFTNLAMPLVRYDVGDRVRLGPLACGCGRPGRVVESIDGRSEDYLWLGDGTRLGRLDHIFKDATRVREAQIVQRARGEMTLRVVRGMGFADDDERQLLAETRHRVGAAMRVDLEYVDRIERTATGKLRLVVSEVS
jgi:phenylacetate-CoA ligase